MKHIVKPSLILFFIAAVSTVFLSLVHAITLEPIKTQNESIHRTAMKTVLPQAADFKEILSEPSGNIVNVYEGSDDGKIVGYVFDMNPAGYGGDIEMMVGISSVESEISGVRVVRHTETPGLGALAVKESFYQQYTGKDLLPLRVVRGSADEGNDIQAITSATITTKAITDAVNEAVEWYNTEQEKYSSDAVTGATSATDEESGSDKEDGAK